MIYKLKYALINRFSTNEHRGPAEPHRMLFGPWGAIHFIIRFIYMCSVATAKVICFYPYLRKSFSSNYLYMCNIDENGIICTQEPNKLFHPLEVINTNKEIAEAERSKWLFSFLWLNIQPTQRFKEIKDFIRQCFNSWKLKLFPKQFPCCQGKGMRWWNQRLLCPMWWSELCRPTTGLIRLPMSRDRKLKLEFKKPVEESNSVQYCNTATEIVSFFSHTHAYPWFASLLQPSSSKKPLRGKLLDCPMGPWLCLSFRSQKEWRNFHVLLKSLNVSCHSTGLALWGQTLSFLVCFTVWNTKWPTSQMPFRHFWSKWEKHNNEIF